MERMWVSALTGLLIFINIINGLPMNEDKDVMAKDENGLVYVFNIYAVRNSKTEAVGKMLSDRNFEKMPPMFEPIGSILIADEDPEPFNMGELAEFLEEFGITVDRFDDENNPKVIEVKLDDFIDEADYILSVDDIVKILETEGIVIKITHEGDVKVFEIAFDESIKDLTDQPFTLEELADFFEDEGFHVDMKVTNDRVKAIKIKFDPSEKDNGKKIHDTSKLDGQSDEKIHKSQQESSIANAIERNSDKKTEIENEYENRVIPLNFVTKSDALNKIRRRRSACPECNAGNLIKQYMKNSEIQK